MFTNLFTKCLQVYMAPEVIEKTPYGKAGDLWSLGAVIYDMMAIKIVIFFLHQVGTPPFHVKAKEKKLKCNRSNTNRSATKYNILHCNYNIPDHVEVEAR